MQSQNGWPASPSLKRRALKVAGVEFVGGIVDNDDVERVFRYVARQFNDRVEQLENPGCWGYSYRANANDPNSLSNHSSGTAIDVNAPKHPNGVAASRTFTAAQISEVHKILAEVDHAIRWGGDYTGTPDAMHFEVIATPARLAEVAARLRKKEPTLTGPEPVPSRWNHFAHYDTPVSFGGGILGDTRRGSKRAKAQGFTRIDCDGHLTQDLVWVNAHGAPYLPKWMKRGDKFEHHRWAPMSLKHPSLRSARQTFTQNAKLGLDTEWEVKDLHPLTKPKQLRVAFANLAADAEAGYGPDWRDHVQVKVLTNLGGGAKYARKILRRAKAAGFTTIVLLRGSAKASDFKIADFYR